MNRHSLVAELDRISSIHDEFEALAGLLSVDNFIVPKNLVAERQRFLSQINANGEVVVPAFEYETMTGRTTALQLISELRDRCAGRSSLAAQRLDNSMLTELEITNEGDLHDPIRVTQRTKNRFGVPSRDLVAEARRLLDIQIPSDGDAEGGEEYSAHGAAAQFRSMLDSLGLQDWEVEVSDRMSARMSVNGALRRLRIRADSRFAAPEVRRLLVHEVGTHVARFEAGLSQRARFLRSGSSDYLEAEEGLACFNERRWGVAQSGSLRTYAARVVAADLALRKGFSDVVSELIDKLGPAAAFDVAVRAKRGIKDLESPGAHLKDIVYLRGFFLVTERSLNGEADPRLNYGKVSFADFPLLDELAREALLTEPPFTVRDVVALLD